MILVVAVSDRNAAARTATIEKPWKDNETEVYTEEPFTYYIHLSRNGEEAWVYRIEIQGENGENLSIPETIPDTVEYIDRAAFGGLNSITAIQLPKKIKIMYMYRKHTRMCIKSGIKDLVSIPAWTDGIPVNHRRTESYKLEEQAVTFGQIRVRVLMKKISMRTFYYAQKILTSIKHGRSSVKTPNIIFENGIMELQELSKNENYYLVMMRKIKL